jgi:predicted nuclease of predicted toxin-antitoxin system
VKLKLDENVDVRVVSLLRLAGHDVATVSGQGLSSAPDEEVIDVCHHEGRCLVTCDRGFGNRLKYNPSKYSGIVIIRLPVRPNFADWQVAIERLIQGLEAAEVIGKLCIIQGGSIQEYQPIEPDI